MKLVKRMGCTALAMTMAVLSGCSSKPAGGGEADLSKDVSFPLGDKVEFSYWCVNDSTGIVNNYSEMRLYQELEKRTNIKLNFEHPISTQVEEQFNVMIASREYPDIVERVDLLYPGGAKRAYNENVIIDLTPYLEKYAPNITKLFEAYPHLKDEALIDGKLLTFPCIKGGNNLRTYQGLVLRQDMLKKYNLEVPETIDEWHNVLTTFKNNGVETPFAVSFENLLKQHLAGAWDVQNDYFLEDGKVKYGVYDDRYKEFLTEMLKWKEEGLIDRDIVSIGSGDKTVDTKIATDRTGAFIASIGGGIGGWLTKMKDDNPSFDLVPAPYPVLNKGNARKIVHRDTSVGNVPGVSITTACKNIPEAVALLDYTFGKEGHRLYNFGIEGESYEIKDGKPVFTDLIMNNPDGKTMSEIGRLYARSFTIGPFVQDTRYGEQFYGQPRQQEASKLWGEAGEKVANYIVRGELTDEEDRTITPKVTEISTYAQEWLAKLFMGEKSIDSYDELKKGLEGVGIDTVLSIKQKAYDRFIEQYPEMKNPPEVEIDEFYWRSEE